MLDEHLAEHGIELPRNRGPIPDQVGGLWSIVLLGLAALVAIWLPTP